MNKEIFLFTGSMGNKLFTPTTPEAEVPVPQTRRRRDSDGYRQVDVFATFEHDADEDTNTVVYASPDGKKTTATEVIRKSFKRCWGTVWRENWLFLIILGLVGAGVAMLIDFSTVKLLEGTNCGCSLSHHLSSDHVC